MGLSHEHAESKILEKIQIYILTRAELLFTLCYEIPCIWYWLAVIWIWAWHNFLLPFNSFGNTKLNSIAEVGWFLSEFCSNLIFFEQKFNEFTRGKSKRRLNSLVICAEICSKTQLTSANFTLWKQAIQNC